MNEDPVIIALSEQLVCYTKLAKLAELQHQFVQHNQTDELLDVLNQRQSEMQKIAGLEVTLGPAKQNWDGYVTKLDATQKLRAEDLIAQSRQLLAQITDRDRDDALILQQRKLNVGREINQARSAVKVNRTYAAAAYGRVASTLNVKQ